MVFSFLSESFYNENEMKLINLIELENGTKFKRKILIFRVEAAEKRLDEKRI